MKKTQKILQILMLLVAYSCYGSQFAPFKGIFYEGDYAVYAHYQGDVSNFTPYKLYIFEEKPSAFHLISEKWWIYDTITVDCPNFTIRLLTNKRYAFVADVPRGGGGSSGGQAMMAPPPPNIGGNDQGGEYEGTSMDYYQEPPNMEAIAAQQRVDQFQFNTPYTSEQIRYSGRVLDEISTRYGKSDVLSLSNVLYNELKTYQKTPGLTFSNFLLNSTAHPLEKMILLQNHMNLFLAPHDYITMYGKTIDGDDPPPLWEPTPDCDTNRLKEIAAFMPVFGGQCNGSWTDIYKCLQVNQAFNDAFNSYVKSIFPNWKSYWENCVKAKIEYEIEECKCQRVVKLDGGELYYWHKLAANNSDESIMPHIKNTGTHGGERPGWLHQNGIGYNPYNLPISSGNVTIGRSGSNQGVGGWDMVRSSVPHRACSHYFEHTEKYGDTSSGPVNYYETAINYSCADFQTELASNCACPIPVQGRVMQRASLAASSKAQAVCFPSIGQTSKHSGKLSFAALAYYAKQNQVTLDAEIKMLDAGQAQATTASSMAINKDFVYKLKKMTVDVAKAIASAIAGKPVIDTSLKDLIDQGLGLASTKFKYDTSVTSNSKVMTIHKDFNFFLNPNDEARVYLEDYTTFHVKGENAGWTELVLGKEFMVGLWTGASGNQPGSQCCRPAFIGVSHIGMSHEKNLLYTNLSAKGGNTERWETDPLSHSQRWGMYNSVTCAGITDITVIPKAAGDKSDKKPNLLFMGNGFEYKNLTKGEYVLNVYTISGQLRHSRTIQISEPNGYLYLGQNGMANELLIIDLRGQGHQFSKKIKYEKF